MKHLQRFVSRRRFGSVSGPSSKRAPVTSSASTGTRSTNPSGPWSRDAAALSVAYCVSKRFEAPTGVDNFVIRSSVWNISSYFYCFLLILEPNRCLKGRLVLGLECFAFQVFCELSASSSLGLVSASVPGRNRRAKSRFLPGFRPRTSAVCASVWSYRFFFFNHFFLRARPLADGRCPAARKRIPAVT